jgi:hypothetical protein
MTQSEIIERVNALNSEKLTLQSQLNSDDYKTDNYDPVELHAKHQAWRDRINDIEDEVKRLEALEPDPEPQPEMPEE